MQDNEMPKGWHLIKSVLIKEIKTAVNFHYCIEACDAMFHARLIGERVAKDTKQFENEAGCESPAVDS